MLDLKQNVQYVKGIGPKRVKVLNSIGIYTLYDLLTYFPRDYEDRTKTKKIIYKRIKNGKLKKKQFTKE